MPRTVGKPWTILDRRSLFTTPRGLEVAVETVELPSGRIVDDYYRIEKPTSAIVAAQTAGGAILTLRQYLHGPRRAGLTLPGGNVEPGEDPLDAIRRELLEETGHTAADWRPLGTFMRDANQGYGTEHVYLATGAARVQPPSSGDLEASEVVALTPAQLRAALADGSVPIVSHAAGMALALLALG
ncbi:NUDIX hydrolase [Azospirillum sp. sgz301742]